MEYSQTQHQATEYKKSFDYELSSIEVSRSSQEDSRLSKKEKVKLKAKSLSKKSFERE